MFVWKEEKAKIVKKFAKKAGDTGCPEVQAAILTAEIENLKTHLATHKKDNHSRRGIMLKVAKRRKILAYLKKKNPTSYEDVIKKLEIRK